MSDRAGRPRRLTLLLPSDCERYTGGYIWDSRVVRELGWTVDERDLPPGFPNPGPLARAGSARVLAGFPDGALILSESYATSTIPEVLAVEARRLRLVTIVHHPFADESGLPAGMRERMAARECRSLRHLAQVIVPSRLTGSSLQRDCGVPAARLTLAYPGTDPAPLARGSRRAEVQLLAVGAVIPRKDQLALIEALGIMPELPWRLRIVGNVVRLPDMAQALCQRAAALGIAERVELAGELSPQDLAAARDGTDLQVSASRHEGYGMALAEGVACGLPTVAVAGGAISERLTPDAALLTEPGDSDGLATALRRAVVDPALRERLRSGALRLRGRLPTWRSAALAVEQALLKALEAPSPISGPVAASTE